MTKIIEISHWLILLQGWKRYGCAFAIGLISALAMAPLYLFPVLFFTLPAFVFLIDGIYGDAKTNAWSWIKPSFLSGWWFGFGYFIAGLWWIGSAFLVEADVFAWMLPIAVLALPACLAIYWGVATIIACLIWSDHWSRGFAFAFAYALMEFARGHLFTGFPWNNLGYGLMGNPVLMQSASILGLYGICLLTIIIFCLPAIGLSQNSKTPITRNIPLLLSVILFTLHMGFGVIRLYSHPVIFEDNLELRIIQPNIAQIDKHNPSKEDAILKSYFTLSKTGQDGKPKSLEGIEYLIWPESAFPFMLTERRDVLTEISNLLPEGTKLITGALRAEPGSAGDPYGKVYNSVLSIGNDGIIQEAADKIHLVPFGEYLPFQSILESLGLEQLTRLRGGFEAGAFRKTLSQNTPFPFLALICYEIIFPSEILTNTDLSTGTPKWIVNVTNDAWFGLTPGPFQHYHQAAVRAVELGLPIVRVANTGISGIIDAYGRTLDSLPLEVSGVLEKKLPVAAEKTLYSQYQNQIFLYLLALCFLIALLGKRSKSV